MYFLNQILAALALAAALIGGIKTVAQSVFPTTAAERIVYPLADSNVSTEAKPTVVAAADADSASPAQAAPVSFAAMIAAADPAKGNGDATICKACHSVKKGAPAKTGPNLWGVVGRDKASFPGFHYTPALSSLGGKWTYDDLNHFLENPQKYAKGTAMFYDGVKNAEKRAELIAYLRTLADQPAPLPSE